MKNDVMVVSARLDRNLASWIKERMTKTQKTSTEVLRELILFRISFEKSPWLEVARLNEEKKRLEGVKT